MIMCCQILMFSFHAGLVERKINLTDTENGLWGPSQLKFGMSDERRMSQKCLQFYVYDFQLLYCFQN